MTFKAVTVTVTDSATELCTAGFGSAYDGGCLVHVANTDESATLYVGGADVTTSNGLPVLAGATEVFVLNAGNVLYGRVASSTLDARVSGVSLVGSAFTTASSGVLLTESGDELETEAGAELLTE